MYLTLFNKRSRAPATAVYPMSRVYQLSNQPQVLNEVLSHRQYTLRLTTKALKPHTADKVLETYICTYN